MGEAIPNKEDVIPFIQAEDYLPETLSYWEHEVFGILSDLVLPSVNQQFSSVQFIAVASSSGLVDDQIHYKATTLLYGETKHKLDRPNS